jgi:hypothetical protein
MAPRAYAPIDHCYFKRDDLLDPPPLLSPGWIGAVEFELLKPHVKSELIHPVPAPGQPANGVAPGSLHSAPLDWTVCPDVSLGYRLPAGFGELALAYRGLSTRGHTDAPAADGLAHLTSRLDFSMIDFDYRSREISLAPRWDMNWMVGVRVLFLFFDSVAEQPAGAAGLLPARESNSLAGAGPHAGLELARFLGDTGFSLVFRTDFTTDLVRVRQGFFTPSATEGTGGGPPAGESRVGNWMDAPIIRAQVGVCWRPPSAPAARVFLGYQYEYWWRAGTNLDTGSRADLWDQGLALQAAFRY